MNVLTDDRNTNVCALMDENCKNESQRKASRDQYLLNRPTWNVSNQRLIDTRKTIAVLKAKLGYEQRALEIEMAIV